MAVYLVIAFHAGLSRLAGGFVGVDVFFVLSGYLVTQVLVRDIDGHGGVRFGRFYSRRVRRLLPASLTALVVTAAFYAAVAGPAQVAAAAGAFKASFLYVVNWYFIDQATDYFGAETAQSPVLHMWSLAVEEQFYIVWPVLLSVLVWSTNRLRRHRLQAVRGALALAVVLSAAWALHLRGTQPERAYFGTDARAYQLLAGALLAFAPTLMRRATRFRLLSQVAAAGSLGALLILVLGLQRLDPIERGIAATIVVLVLIVAIEADVDGPVRRLLSLAPVVYLGQISYATYLWHWPVIIIIGEVVEVSPRPLFVVTVLVATGLASLSYHLIEMPVRSARRLDTVAWPVVGVGVTLSILAALFVAPQVRDVFDDPGTAVAQADVTGLTPVPDSIDVVTVKDELFGETVSCVDRSPEDCTVVEGAGPHILLMGDSNAQMWIPAFTAMAEAEDLSLSLVVEAGCLWQRDVYYLTQEIMERCQAVKSDAYDRVIPELDPDLIVLVNTRRGEPYEEFVDNDDLVEAMLASTPGSVEELAVGDRDVLIIEPWRQPVDRRHDPTDCLGRAAFVAQCRFVASDVENSLVELHREVAASADNVTTASLDGLICPFMPICDPIVNGLPAYYDGKHISARYSESLGPAVFEFLSEQGLVG